MDALTPVTGTSTDSQLRVFLASKESRTLQVPGECSITKEGSTLSPLVLRDGKLNDIILQILSGSWHHWRESLRAQRTIHLKGSHGLLQHTGKMYKNRQDTWCQLLFDQKWLGRFPVLQQGKLPAAASSSSVFGSNPWDSKPSQRLSSGCAKWIPGAGYGQVSLQETQCEISASNLWRYSWCVISVWKQASFCWSEGASLTQISAWNLMKSFSLIKSTASYNFLPQDKRK